jgi:hypothetical protein
MQRNFEKTYAWIIWNIVMTDFRCFKSIGLKSPHRLQFVIQADKDKLGYVSYQNGSGAIPVKLLKEKELKKVPGGRPSEFESHGKKLPTTERVESM